MFSPFYLFQFLYQSSFGFGAQNGNWVLFSLLFIVHKAIAMLVPPSAIGVALSSCPILPPSFPTVTKTPSSPRFTGCVKYFFASSVFSSQFKPIVHVSLNKLFMRTRILVDHGPSLSLSLSYIFKFILNMIF